MLARRRTRNLATGFRPRGPHDDGVLRGELLREVGDLAREGIPLVAQTTTDTVAR